MFKEHPIKIFAKTYFCRENVCREIFQEEINVRKLRNNSVQPKFKSGMLVLDRRWGVHPEVIFLTTSQCRAIFYSLRNGSQYFNITIK